ncbi:hypothetical protein, partial [Solihabitans fulvus]
MQSLQDSHDGQVASPATSSTTTSSVPAPPPLAARAVSTDEFDRCWTAAHGSARSADYPDRP